MPSQYIDTTRKAIDCATTLLSDSFYIMKLCSRLLVLYCRNLYERREIQVFDPHFEEVRGGVELRRKPLYDFLFVIIELFFR